MPPKKQDDLEWYKALGREPKSFGHHEPGHAECDLAPCKFRVACQAFQAYCRDAKADVDATKKALPEAAKAAIIRDRVKSMKGREIFYSVKHATAWERFVKVFAQALNGEARVMPNRDSAATGELYMKARYVGDEKMPRAWFINQRTANLNNDSVLIAMEPGNTRELRPHLSIRTSAVQLLDQYPQLDTWAERWLQVGGRENDNWRMGRRARAIRVQRTRLDDLARLCARLLKDNQITTCKWPLDGRRRVTPAPDKPPKKPRKPRPAPPRKIPTGKPTPPARPVKKRLSEGKWWE